MSQNQPSEGGAEAPLNLKKFAAGAESTEADRGQTSFIKKSADQLASKLPGSSPDDDTFGVPLKDLLGMITYCYVRGVFSSKEISEKFKNEPVLRKAFGRQLPDEHAIKTFRRQYAEEIEDLLETVYRVYPSADAGTSAEPGASQTEIVHREAVERLHEASWEDTMRRHLH